MSDSIPATDQQLCDTWIQLNRPYAANDNYGTAEAASADYVTGTTKILLSAPHAVVHRRNGNDKKADLRTGGLCQLLSQRAGVAAVIASGYVPKWYSWQDRNDAFKTIVQHAVDAGLVVLDIHGMKDAYGPDICLGLGPSPSNKTLDLARYIQNALLPLDVSINTPFAALRPHNVTSYVHSIGGDGLHVEIAVRFRRPAHDPARAAALVRAWTDLLRHLGN